ncbi:MAG: carbamoyltransferase HypF [Opitutus sp.]|nr:carbamoyltransferase HypF [Opitutus sp.]
MPTTSTALTDVLVRVRGTVQGVGFRPFVHRVALQHGLRGWVRNDLHGVLLRAVGDPGAVEALLHALRHEAPPAAHVSGVERADPTDADPPAGAHFTISESELTFGAAHTATPADLALCGDCRRELLDPDNRRAGYPFINCTQCGPRYSIIEQLPYDRPRTTMRAFRMCPACDREYRNPRDRRYHAEPNACPVCGPQLRLTDVAGQLLGDASTAIDDAVAALQAGFIGAVKGVGGFHLVCDATNETAVAELRRRKHREEKPLAVMFADLAAVRAHAEVSDSAAALLHSPAAPIVLVPRRSDSTLAGSIAPGNPWLGVLLPYAPVHVLLLRALGRPIVATSANLSEEPICTDDAEARDRLAGIAEFFLTHNRPIARPVDDSVVRETPAGGTILLRRARGYAPAPLALPGAIPQVTLCVGGHMKNTVALASGDQVIVSPHIGDLGNAASQAVFERTVTMLADLHGTRPALVVHDKHPDYASTHFAGRSGLPTLGVQHHLAHLLACLLEHGLPADNVLGIVWDGTGYGEDGTIWGGEFILLKKRRATRFARLRPFRLPGGEAAVRDPRRVALGLAHEMGNFAAVAARLGLKSADQLLLEQMLERRLNSPLCSSGGRLFDAVGALLGLCHRNTFEGQVPLHVEAAAARATVGNDTLPFAVVPCTDGSAMFEVDWAPAIHQLLLEERNADERAAEFHRGLAGAMLEVAIQSGVSTVALTGGCFQNALLHDLAGTALRQAGFTVLAHHRLSPNDNSIAPGQALAALWGLTTVERPS